MSLRSTLALHLGDLKEKPRDREDRLQTELGNPENLSRGTLAQDSGGQLWRVARGRRRNYWERTLTLTPEKRDRMYQLIRYGRWATFIYLLGWAAFYFARLDALNVDGMVPSYVLFEMTNAIAPAFIFIFFLRYLPKTAAVIAKDGTISPAWT